MFYFLIVQQSVGLLVFKYFLNTFKYFLFDLVRVIHISLKAGTDIYYRSCPIIRRSIIRVADYLPKKFFLGTLWSRNNRTTSVYINI